MIGDHVFRIVRQRVDADAGVLQAVVMSNPERWALGLIAGQGGAWVSVDSATRHSTRSVVGAVAGPALDSSDAVTTSPIVDVWTQENRAVVRLAGRLAVMVQLAGRLLQESIVAVGTGRWTLAAGLPLERPGCDAKRKRFTCGLFTLVLHPESTGGAAREETQ